MHSRTKLKCISPYTPQKNILNCTKNHVIMSLDVFQCAQQRTSRQTAKQPLIAEFLEQTAQQDDDVQPDMRRCDISVPKLHLAPMMAPCPTRGHTTNTEDTTCLEHTKRKKKKTCTKKQSVFRNNHHAIMTRHRKKGVQKKSNAVTQTTYPCRTLNMCSATRIYTENSVPQMNTEGSCSQMEAPHRTSTRIIRKSTSKKKNGLPTADASRSQRSHQAAPDRTATVTLSTTGIRTSGKKRACESIHHVQLGVAFRHAICSSPRCQLIVILPFHGTPNQHAQKTSAGKYARGGLL